MKVEAPRVFKEISRLNWSELENEDLTELTKDLEQILNQLGFTLSTRLTDVMRAGNDRTFDSKANIQSNWLNMYMDSFMPELLNAGDPVAFIDDEIEKIETEFTDSIIETIAYKTDVIFKPVTKWSKATVAFYCHQQKPNVELADLLYFIFVFEYGSEKEAGYDLLQDVLHDFSRGTANSMYLQELKNKRKEYGEYIVMPEQIHNDISNISEIRNLQKLKWLGTPAQFGFIMQELIGKGYLERPTASHAKDAAFYLSIFDIETTPGTLAKELSPSSSLSADNARHLSISHINKLR